MLQLYNVKSPGDGLITLYILVSDGPEMTDQKLTSFSAENVLTITSYVILYIQCI